MEQVVYKSLLNVHKIGEENNDPQFTDFIEGEFLEEQINAINEQDTRPSPAPIASSASTPNIIQDIPNENGPMLTTIQNHYSPLFTTIGHYSHPPSELFTTIRHQNGH